MINIKVLDEFKHFCFFFVHQTFCILQATDKTKTEDEVAKEEAEKLKQLEVRFKDV